MKKIFTLLAAAAVAGSLSAQTYLVAYNVEGQENHGYKISGTTDDNRTVKLEDGTTITALSFNNNWSYGSNDNYIQLSTDGGFKAGDVITVKGVIANNDESKRGACKISTIADDKAQELFKTEDFVNLNLTPTNDVPAFTYTLAENATDLYLSRDGNTRTQMIYISVVRSEGGNDDPAPVEGVAFTTTGNGSGTFGKTFDSIVTPFEFDAATMTGTFKNFLGSNTTVELKWTITNENKKPEETGAIFDAEPVSGLGEIQTVAGYYKMCAINDFTGSVIFKQDGVNFGKLDNVLLGVGFSSQIEVVTIDGARYHEVNLMLGGDYSKWDAEKSEWVASGQNYFKLVKNIPMSGDTSAIEAIEAADENAPVEYYNIQGMRVNEPAAGQLLIRRQGSKVSKVIIR